MFPEKFFLVVLIFSIFLTPIPCFSQLIGETTEEKIEVRGDIISNKNSSPLVIVPELEQTAAEHEEIYISIEKEGWLLESITKVGGTISGSIRFIGRNYQNGKTIFSFFAYKPGVFKITIRKTDYSVGSVERKIINLSVLKSESSSFNKNVQTVEPVEEYTNVKENKKNIENLETQETQETIENQESLKNLQNDNNAGAGYKKFKTLDEALAYIDEIIEKEDCKQALFLLNTFLQEFKQGDIDKIYYRIGFIFEESSSCRDERRAAEAYQAVVDNYPLSRYWSDSQRRLKYIERNYIYIR